MPRLRLRPWAGLFITYFWGFVSIRCVDQLFDTAIARLSRAARIVPLFGLLIAVQHRLRIPPAAQLAEHLQRLVHQFGREFAPDRVPATTILPI